MIGRPRSSVRGAPLAVQVTVLLIGSLVVAQLVTLALTLLLPPRPPPEYRLADVAAALKGGALDGHAPRPLVRSLRAEPPSLASAGWTAPEPAREDLARLLGARPEDVRLLFYAPAPFAGAGALAAMAPRSRLYTASLAFLDLAPPGGPGPAAAGSGDGVRGGGFGGSPGDRAGGPDAGGSRRGGLAGGRGGGSPSGGGPGGRGGFGAGRGVTPADAGVVSHYPSGRTAAGGGAFGGQHEDAPGASSVSAHEPRAARVDDGAHAPFSARAAAAARAATLGGGGLPAGALAAGIAAPAIVVAPQLPRIVSPGAAIGVPEIERPAPRRTATGTEPLVRPNRLVTRAGAAISPASPSDVAPPATPVLDPAGARIGALTPAQALAVVRGQTRRAEADRGGYVLPSAGSEPRGLFGLAPAPFVQGDFVAALRTASGRWVTVQPQAEPFPNAWQRRVLLWFLTAFAVVAPLGLVFARRLAAPLAAFAEAAERLGKDPSGAHLQLQGPAEVGRAARAFNRMQGRLKRYIDDRTAMVGAISHDLRTPLARMRFRLERAPPQVREPVLADIAQMEEMISAVLVFIRDASEPAVRERVDLRSILECVVDDAALVGGAASLDPGEPAPVDVDSLSVQRVLTNLVENALKYGETAHVRMYAEGAEAVTEVEDTGPGLPEDEMERVFLPFYRSEQARTLDTRGIGLGLAVSRSIARAHGGDVKLLSRGQGLVAQLRLPLAQKAA